MTYTKSDLQSLLERLEKAEGPNFELERQIAASIAGGTLSGEFGVKWPDNTVTVAPKYTASLDAAIALVEKVLPGWFWNVETSGDCYNAYAVSSSLSDFDSYNRPTPAIALLIAMVKALIAECEE